VSLPVAAPSRVLERLRSAPDGPVPVLHRGLHAAYVDVGGWAVGLLARDAVAVPCGLRSRLPDLADWPVEHAEVRAGALVLDGRPLQVTRVVDVRVRPRPRPGSVRPLDVAALVGCGPGLTPYGDDVVCGWLAAHRAAGRATPEADAAVREAAARTTVLSATLLDCALRGEVLPELARWLTAAGTPDEPAAERALLAVGATSGAGLLEGARAA